MSTEIYYFSGTGNSLAVARDIAGKINGKLISVASVMKKESINPDADVIGIVFPVYYIINTGLPLIISRFTKKLSNIDSKYIFSVCTCGGGSGGALKTLGNIIESRGGKLSAGFTVIMPSNVTSVAKEKQQKILNNWKKKLEVIYDYVNSRKAGKIDTTHLLARIIFAPLVPFIKPLILGPLKKLSGSKDLPFDELVYLSDKSYLTDSNCKDCGTCENVCPVNNIKMTDDKPEWLHHCETCLACFHWCPEKAIHGGIISKMNDYHYHHPDITISDMLKHS